MKSILTYTQAKAVQAIAKHIDGDVGNVVVSRIADEASITHSTAAGALKMLSFAGIIRTRSLGMKGTLVQVLDPERWRELTSNDD